MLIDFVFIGTTVTAVMLIEVYKLALASNCRVISFLVSGKLLGSWYLTMILRVFD